MNQGFKAFTKSTEKKASDQLGMTNATPNSNFIIPKLRKANANAAAATSTKFANSDGEVSGKRIKLQIQ